MKRMQTNTGTDQSDWMPHVALGSHLGPPHVPAAEAWERSGAFQGMVGGEESSGKGSYFSIALEVFQYLSTSVAVQMGISGKSP